MNRTLARTSNADRQGDGSVSDGGARPAIGALDFWAFVLPAVSFIEITIVGRLIVTEILMLAMLPWLLSARDRLALPRWFVVLWAGWLLSQIVTDLVVRSAFEDYARGWAAIIFTMTNFAAILVLASTPRRARLFALGLAAGGALGYLLVPNVYAAFDPWKWAFALPVGLALAASLAGPVGARRPWLTVIAFLAFGALNLFFGFRSLGGVSLITAGYLAFGAVFRRKRVSYAHSMWRRAAGLVLLSLAVVGVLQLYDVAASSGLLGADARSRYEMQSGDLGVLLGGRPEVLAATQAVIDSPILGHGSWAKDFTYVDLLAERQSSLGYEVGAGPFDVGLIPAHSYLVGSWVWAGVFGGVFWIAILWMTIRLLANLYSYSVELAPLLAFCTVLLLWNIAFSPYGFSARIAVAYSAALCLLGLRLLQRAGVDQPSPQPLRTNPRSAAMAHPVPPRPAPPLSRTRPDRDAVAAPNHRELADVTPRISVLVPAYNAGAYLREALNSALNQMPQPYEVVVQDGGSTDQTLDILRSFGERVAWVSGPDGGQADALNKALARASGDIVLWLNADDLVLPGALAAAADAFAADRNLAFAYGDFDIIDGAGALVRHYQSSRYSWSRVFARGCYIFSGSTFIRREALLTVGQYDASLRACMDLDLLLRLDAAGPSRHLGRTFGQLRMHGSNKSSTMRRVFLLEAFRVRRRYTGRSIRLWVIALREAATSAVMLGLTPIRFSSRWPRHGRSKTL